MIPLLEGLSRNFHFLTFHLDSVYPILSESELSYFRRKTFLRMSGQNSWKT
jgi:hypothetical protein